MGIFENLFQMFRFATLPINFVSEMKRGPCPTLTIKGFLDSFAIIRSCFKCYPWLSMCFAGISSNDDLAAVCLALLPSINTSTYKMNISLSLFSPRFDTLDWAKRQTIQKEIHFRLKPNFPLCSKGKDARLFRTNFFLITGNKTSSQSSVDAIGAQEKG